MEKYYLYVMILGMSIVTYLPRFVPTLFVDHVKMPQWVHHWLRSIPYAAMGALIFPGILQIQKGNMAPGIVGGIMAIILSLLKVNLIVVLLGSIAAVIGWEYLITKGLLPL